MNKNKDYQIIFIGHSFGGAIATLSIFSFVKNYLEDRDPVLITFGQPRVGNEEFAKKFNELIQMFIESQILMTKLLQFLLLMKNYMNYIIKSRIMIL